MTLSNIIDFARLQQYDGLIKNWVKNLTPTADVLYTAEDAEVIAGTKEVGDVKVAGHNGVISRALYDKLVNLLGINGLKLNLTGTAGALTPDSNGDVTIDVTSKADKVSGATADNFAGLDSNGNLKDSGKNASDFATDTQGGYADSALQTVSAEGAGYVSASFAAKSGNNGAKTQALSVSLTTKSVSDAASNDNGLATAYDVKQYVAGIVAAGINYRGSVNNYSALLAISNPQGGDMYNVKNDETVSNVWYPGDMNYVYVAAIEADAEQGIEAQAAFWDPQSPTVKIETATAEQINGLFS